ncbi:MAG: hypothetical protein ACJA2W_004103, partial [Planctomycetota bacterium]
MRAGPNGEQASRFTPTLPKRRAPVTRVSWQATRLPIGSH